ncbi:MAG TPA: HlyD family efflux transporter periplasmic adaptor subunit [Phycisphaerae bacterium]|nr:HlyD family efflux transporter periplasmic adaptor subunit [Phycisphaerae bacterium]HNU44250.1 HlyD family efflux transporter periplasmic adaptor subunit [Phycisphaerae bacterium]
MDVPRPSVARRRLVRRLIGVAVAVGIVAGVTWGLSRLEPAAPAVERSAVWLDTVKRGAMLRQVRGTGSLVPEMTWWVPAVTDGRIERILVLPGATVQADTVLLELSNPELDLAAVSAEWQLKSAEADLAALRVSLQNELLTLRASMARLEADHQEALLQQEVDEELFADGLTSERQVKLSRVRVEQLAGLIDIERGRLETWDASQEARLAAQQARVEEARALHGLKAAQVEALRVKAGTTGVLEQVPVEVGQRVGAGTALAKVTDVRSLKAVVRIPETQARDVQAGQPAAIDTHNGIVRGRVVRVDPAAQQGTVAVDVKLEDELPRGARPDLTVVGTVEIERLEDILYVGRPVHGQAGSTISLFKLRPDGVTADRVPVELGSSSVDTVEIRRGLAVGDQVVLSDMSRWDEFDRVRLR